MITFDFDDINQWGPSLSKHLSSLVNKDASKIIAAHQPKYYEDAAEIFLSEVCPKDAFAKLAKAWLNTQSVAAYHGSRLDEADIENVQENGLQILSAVDRKMFLEKKLSGHPKWREVRGKLDQVLDDLGRKESSGRREKQVHATISRSGLVEDFNYYLRWGSEFDLRAAQKLIGKDAELVLSQFGKATLITLAIPGEKAFDAANPFGFPYDTLPNLIREMTQAWSYWLVKPDFSPVEINVDLGLMFFSPIDKGWIDKIELMNIKSA